MRKTFQPLSPFTQPVSEALYQMQHWIERDKASRLLHAAPSRRDLKRRHWPEHVRISAAKPLGRRVTARGPRRKALAYWPDDGCQASLHPFLVCVMNGKAALRIADYNLHCQAGDWVFIPQGIARSTRSHLDPSQPDGQCNLLWFYLDETKNQFYAWIGHSEKSIHHSGPDYGTCWVESSQLARQFLSLCEEIQNGENPDVLYHLLSCVILLLRREIEQGHSFLPRHHQTGRHDNSSQSHPNPIERACIYIDEHLEHSLTADQIARYVCMSLTLFSRHFRRHAGCTFHEYLTARRLEKASALLRETDTSVDTISRFVGLHYSQLRRLFYRHHQCTPGEFRQQWIKQHSSASHK